MDGRNIAGYYYDEEKKKYFKIQANHVAPAGSKYSRESVKKEQREKKKRKHAEFHHERQNRQLVRRCHPLHRICYSQGGLDRELGLLQRPTSHIHARAAAFTHGLAVSPGLVAGYRFWPFIPGDGIDTFVWDEATKGVLYGHNENGASRSALVAALASRNTADPISLPPMAQETRHRFNSDITSISISPTRAALVTTSGAADRPTILFMTLTDPALLRDDTPPDFDVSISYHRPEHVSVWTSAANPFTPSSTSFVVGLSDKACLFANTPSQWCQTQSIDSDSDIFATDWLNPVTASLGLRNGTVKLWDVRSGGAASRLRHPTSITNLRCVNRSQIVVAGLEDTMALYDLRMARESPHKATSGKERWPKRPRSAKHSASQPVLHYTHTNDIQRPIGFDVMPELGLIAAASNQGIVELHSLYQGTLIRRIPVTADGYDTTKYDVRVRCLRFVVSNERTRLLASSGSRIVEIAW